jgi:hypothetical protein
MQALSLDVVARCGRVALSAAYLSAVFPAKAGIHVSVAELSAIWVPAFAGKTISGGRY